MGVRLVREANSIQSIVIKDINISKSINHLEEIFEALVSKHAHKVKKLTLINVSISTIFEV